MTSTKSWIHITAPAVAAGAVASVLTYTLLIHTSEVAASGTGLLLDGAGAVLAAGTRYFVGDLPAMSVRILGRVCSEGSAASIRSGGTWTSLAAAAAVGGTTVLTVSLGTKIIEATIEYGGAISQVVAARVAEAYLRFKQEPLTDSVLDVSGLDLNIFFTESEDDDWIQTGFTLPEMTSSTN